MNLLMNIQAFFLLEKPGNLFGIQSVFAYAALFHHFMGRHRLLDCGPLEKKIDSHSNTLT